MPVDRVFPLAEESYDGCQILPAWLPNQFTAPTTQARIRLAIDRKDGE